LVALLWAMRLRYFFGLLFFGACAVWLYAVWGAYASSLIGVSFSTLLLRDFGVFRRTVLIWPVNQQIIDWEKVDHLIAVDDAASAVSSPIA